MANNFRGVAATFAADTVGCQMTGEGKADSTRALNSRRALGLAGKHTSFSHYFAVKKIPQFKPRDL